MTALIRQFKSKAWLVGVLLLAPCLHAQNGCVLQGGARVFIPEMQGNLDGFIAAEFVKQHISLTVTQDKDSARYVLLSLAMEDNPNWFSWWNGLTMKDMREGNVRLFDTGSKDMLWSGEAGDRHLFFNELRRSGNRKVAQRIVKHMKSGCSLGPGPGISRTRDKPYDGYPHCSFAPFC